MESVKHASMFVLALLIAVSLVGAVPQPSGCEGLETNESLQVPDRYIVTLKPKINLSQHLEFVRDLHARSLSRRLDSKTYDGVTYQYDISEDFQGYAGHFDKSVIQKLRARPDVAAIESDAILATASAGTSATLKTQANAPYHLGQISHRDPKKGNEGYVYDGREGGGTFAYILDSGLDIRHHEFDRRQNRARIGFDVTGTEDQYKGADTSGHGTHVAALIGGKTYGVAKDCTLISVKVFWGKIARTSDFLKGYNYATKSIRGASIQKWSVINASLGGGWTFAMNAAIRAAAKKGVTTVVSAGNNDKKACWTKSAIVVGATDENRKRAKFSNWGPSVSVFAPGVNIKSAWIGYGDEKTMTVSGTSMAAPLVAGVILMLKSTQDLPNHKATREALLKLATRDVVGDPRNSSNLFLYNGSGK